jgi:hypothetical protein
MPVSLGKEALVVGARAMVTNKGETLQGEIAFFGSTQFAAGEWVGVALDKPEGKNDGTVREVRYFTCKPNHGLFVRARSVLPLPPVVRHTQRKNTDRKITATSFKEELLDDEDFGCAVGEADVADEVRSSSGLIRLWRAASRVVMFMVRLQRAARRRKELEARAAEAATKIQAARKGMLVRKTTNQQLLELEDERLMRNPEIQIETAEEVMEAKASLAALAPMLTLMNLDFQQVKPMEQIEEEEFDDDDDESDDGMCFF